MNTTAVQEAAKSRVVYKGALDGKGAHSTWVGNALIQPTAPGSIDVPYLLGVQTDSFDWLIGNERWKARVEGA